MENKKKLQKLSLKKETISELNKKELSDIQGGWTTTIGDCSHFACCCSFFGCGKTGDQPGGSRCCTYPPGQSGSY